MAGFNQDDCRLKYLTHLRAERKRSPRAEADADHLKAKTGMLKLRLMERKSELVRRDEHEAMIDQMAGLVLTKLRGWPARVAGTDPAMRRGAEAVLYELRVEIATACREMADKNGEPLDL